MDKSVCSLVVLFVVCSTVCGVDFFKYNVVNKYQAPMFDLSIKLPVTGRAFIRSMEETERRHSDFRFTGTYYAIGWFIEGINNVFGNKELKTYWELFQNGVHTDVGVSDLFPAAGDVVLFNFTSYASNSTIYVKL